MGGIARRIRGSSESALKWIETHINDNQLVIDNRAKEGDVGRPLVGLLIGNKDSL
jgi:hypothetical protein